MVSKAILRFLVLTPLLLLGSCQALYLGTLEQFGIEKREVLHERIAEAGDALIITQQRLREAIAVYSETIHLESGDISESHRRFTAFYNSSEEAANDFSDRINSIQAVAAPMFEEWKIENGEIIDADLRRKSRANFTQALNQYQNLLRSMRAVEAQMDPLLTRFNDHVLFMKLNLHPKAFASLREGEEGFGESVEQLTTLMQLTHKKVLAFLEVATF